MDERDQHYAIIVAAQGAVFQGIQRGNHGALVLFADPSSRSTLAVSESEFSPESIQ
jgi:hypothetical protein